MRGKATTAAPPVWHAVVTCTALGIVLALGASVPVAAQRVPPSPGPAPAPANPNCAMRAVEHVAPRVVTRGQVVTSTVELSWSCRAVEAPLAVAVMIGEVGVASPVVRLDQVRQGLSGLVDGLDLPGGPQQMGIASVDELPNQPIAFHDGAAGRDALQRQIADLGPVRRVDDWSWRRRLASVVQQLSDLDPTIRTALVIVDFTAPQEVGGAGPPPPTVLASLRTAAGALTPVAVLDGSHDRWLSPAAPTAAFRYVPLGVTGESIASHLELLAQVFLGHPSHWTFQHFVRHQRWRRVDLARPAESGLHLDRFDDPPTTGQAVVRKRFVVQSQALEDPGRTELNEPGGAGTAFTLLFADGAALSVPLESAALCVYDFGGREEHCPPGTLPTRQPSPTATRSPTALPPPPPATPSPTNAQPGATATTATPHASSTPTVAPSPTITPPSHDRPAQLYLPRLGRVAPG